MDMPTRLPQAGDRVPDFEVTTVDGGRARYDDLWQRRNLVLVTLPGAADDAARAYLAQVRQRLSGLDDTTFVACESGAAPLPDSMLVVCDRWGEIVHAQELNGGVSRWPTADEIGEWVQFVRIQCPECPP